MTKSDLLSRQTGLDSPATGLIAITPSDSTDLTNPIRAIYNGDTVANDIVVICTDGNIATIKNLPAGAIFPALIARVKSTGTNVTNILGLL